MPEKLRDRPLVVDRRQDDRRLIDGGEGHRRVEVALGGRAVADPAHAMRLSPLMALAIAQPTACGYWVPRLPEIEKKPCFLSEYMIGSWRPFIWSPLFE